jgi:VWFA-related protein
MQAHNFALKMTDLAKALRYVPGNKHIILLSSGVPYSLVYGVQSPEGKIGVEDFGEFWLAEKFEDMLRELAATNCSIYAIDTHDLAASIGGDLKLDGASSLQKITSATGGKYFGNVNNYEQHVEKIQELTGCYYVLGYYVDDKWDGAFRKIKVEVGRPDCSVFSQKGYFNPIVSHYNLNNSNWLQPSSDSFGLVNCVSTCKIGVFSKAVTLRICKKV